MLALDAGQHLVRYLRRHVARPAFLGIERDHAQWLFELAFDQVADDRGLARFMLPPLVEETSIGGMMDLFKSTSANKHEEPLQASVVT